MDGYDYLAGFLLLFVFFIYITWFGFSVKVENQKEKSYGLVMVQKSSLLKLKSL